MGEKRQAQGDGPFAGVNRSGLALAAQPGEDRAAAGDGQKGFGMVVKELKRALLYSTSGYHALVNPAGVAVHLGTVGRCLEEFFYIRWPNTISINDVSLDSVRTALRTSGWRIVKVKMAIFTDDVDPKALLEDSSVLGKIAGHQP